ncbi:MAG: hypothetical protein ACK559_12340, partial [bacterium]
MQLDAAGAKLRVVDRLPRERARREAGEAEADQRVEGVGGHGALAVVGEDTLQRGRREPVLVDAELQQHLGAGPGRGRGPPYGEVRSWRQRPVGALHRQGLGGHGVHAHGGRRSAAGAQREHRARGPRRVGHRGVEVGRARVDRRHGHGLQQAE